MSDYIPIKLIRAGGRWFHTSDRGKGLNLSRTCLGDFMYECLKRGVHVGTFWALATSDRAFVQVPVFMTDEMKAAFETESRFRFQELPKLNINRVPQPIIGTGPVDFGPQEK